MAWLGLALAGVYVVGITCVLLVFSVPPFPVSPGTQLRNDFSGIAWLPHVAVTRLTERKLEGTTYTRVLRRCAGAGVVLLGLGLLPLVVLWTRDGASVGAKGIAVFLGLVCGILYLGFLGREIAGAKAPPRIGTDIG